ncbi:unnamed protein product [Adineta steineri]|uniref:Uncharacterized protein n=1 Tax=Adineta steineri TaxID=433720 RepID=A0A814WRA1_9BILA|nr:unnamed protein product [Adineta steineri]CAF3849609.1 unnamed protein product [Adineta steineri]
MQSNGIKFMGLIMIGLVLCMMSMSVTGRSPIPPEYTNQIQLTRPDPRIQIQPTQPDPRIQIQPTQPSPTVSRPRDWTCDCGPQVLDTQACCGGVGTFNSFQRCQHVSSKQSFINCCGGRHSHGRCN